MAPVQAAPRGVSTTSGVPTIRLIFTDGSVVPLPEGSARGAPGAVPGPEGPGGRPALLSRLRRPLKSPPQAL